MILPSSQFVGSLTDFYAVKAKGKSWFQDRKWLEQDWRSLEADVEIFRTRRIRLGYLQVASTVITRQ
jgi:hypothetical protein